MLMFIFDEYLNNVFFRTGNGKVLHKLRGHDKAVVSLVWCPIPFNIFPQKPNNFVQFKKKEEIITEEMESTDSETVHVQLFVI